MKQTKSIPSSLEPPPPPPPSSVAAAAAAAAEGQLRGLCLACRTFPPGRHHRGGGCCPPGCPPGWAPCSARTSASAPQLRQLQVKGPQGWWGRKAGQAQVNLRGALSGGQGLHARRRARAHAILDLVDQLLVVCSRAHVFAMRERACACICVRLHQCVCVYACVYVCVKNQVCCGG